ncbi:MAG: DUF4292 domain-containing protein [Porphyromonas sp.]|nr:DUF4292 domain-containing protein [Porphyromonas sp.]
MNRNNIVRWATALAVVMLLSSCGIFRKLSGDKPLSSPFVTDRQMAIEAINSQPQVEILEGRGGIAIKTSKSNVSSRCVLHVSKDQYASLSVRPLGLIEVGRMTITPKKLLVVDRFNKQAFRTSVGVATNMFSMIFAGWDLAALQCILLAQPFTPSKQGEKAIAGMEYVPNASGFTLTKKEGKVVVRLDYSPLPAPRLREAHVYYGSKVERVLSCFYDRYQPIGQSETFFPKKITIKTYPDREEKAQSLITLTLDKTLEKLPAEAPSTDIPKGYRSVSWAEVISMIKDLQK